MTQLAAPTPRTADPAAPMAPAELVELLAAFNEVTTRLQATHEQLNAEVVRLRTELVEANQELERSRRLAALGEMAAGIAHEVRNPLGSIRLYAKMLDEDLTDRPAQRDTVRKIAGAARGLDQIVGDMLSFSREFRVRVATIDAEELFDQAIQSCCHDGVPAWQRTMVVRTDATRKMKAVHADQALAQQALVNVLRNAFEAIQEQESQASQIQAGQGQSGQNQTSAVRTSTLVLDVAQRQVDVGDGRTRAMTVLSVRDSGPGVSEETIKRMFNPFYTTRATGTGLGLAIVHRIMDAHGGRVVVRNNAPDLGEPGATVELMFPTRRIEEEAAEAFVRQS